MPVAKTFMQSVCAAAVIVAAGFTAASAQQTIAPASTTPAPGPMPEILQKYAPVTAQRLKNPEPANWLLFRRTYDGWGFSPLEQINRDNVSRLQPVWSYATGQVEGHQAPPIINNGVMFVATPGNQVLALEAKTGNLLWRYRRPFPEDMTPLHPTSRGVGVYGDKVYFAAAESVLVALDAKTGKEAWTAKVDDYKVGHYMTLMPLVIDGKVLVAASGGELGIRGFLAAYDAETGKQLWRTYTVPAPGEPGSDTWPAGGDHWKHGGATMWMTGNYDPESNLTFWGTGNAAPWFGDQRPGDNLYTSSTVAIDPETGALKGHFQYHWNESWDWDEMDAPLVLDYHKGGRAIKGLVHPARNGYLYLLERSKDRISFVSATPYVKQNVFSRIDPTTGRPDYHPERIPRTGKRADFCPSLWGGKDWPNVAWNPKTGRLYMPTNDNHCGFMEGKVQQYVPGKWWTGIDIPDIGFTADKSATYFGEIQAWDVGAAKKVWTHQFPASMAWGGLLTTAGDLVFGGGTYDRYFRAFDAATGKVLWQFRSNSGINAPPVSFSVGGVQYIAVVSGWGVDPEYQQGLLSGLLGWPKDIPVGGVIWVFALSQ
jgi:alcohol dehydrogenase (cytochrome c)